MTLDILIPVAEKGGVENVINETALFLMENGVSIRVVQLVWENTRWTAPGIDFYPLLTGRHGHDLNEFVDTYKDFLKNNGSSDLILATAWPYASYIAKQACLQLKLDTPVASWLHTLPSRYELAGYGDFSALNFADIHFAISGAIKREILSHTPRGPIFKINNPIDILSIPQIVRTPDGLPKNLVFVGRLSVEKHPEVMIEAISKTKEPWNLRFFGSGDKKFEQSLLSLSKQLRVNNKIFFHGWQTEPWKNIEMADALVLASEYEGFPLSAIEANAAGIPVISTAFPGIDELIVPGKNGYIFEKNNPAELAEILNAMSLGKLPPCTKEDCMESAKPYEKTLALSDFYKKILKIFQERETVLNSGGTDGILYLNDKISIILPCYNVSPYLKECLDSIVNQNFPKVFYEIICINDASTDDTLDILMEYESMYPELIMVVNCEENSGLGAVRNLGTYTYSSGNLIAYIDSDDKIHKDYLRTLYENMVIYNAELSMAGYYKFHGVQKEDVPLTAGFFNMDNPSEKKNFILYNGVNNSACAKIYRKDFIVQNNLSFPEKVYMEDIWFYQMAMMKAHAIIALPVCIYAYRMNQDSIMNNLSKKHLRQLDIYKVQKMSLNQLTSEGLLAGYEEEFALTYYVRAFISLLPEATIESIDDDRKEVFKTIKKETLEVFPGFFDNPYINADKSRYNQELIQYFKNL